MPQCMQTLSPLNESAPKIIKLASPVRPGWVAPPTIRRVSMDSTSGRADSKTSLIVRELTSVITGVPSRLYRLRRYNAYVNSNSFQFMDLGDKAREEGTRRRNCCNCKKSHCLKLYCECFSSGSGCQGCNCVGCHNDGSLVHREEHEAAVKSAMERTSRSSAGRNIAVCVLLSYPIVKSGGVVCHGRRGCQQEKAQWDPGLQLQALPL